MAGGVLSTTVTVNELFELPHEFVAVAATRVVPTGNDVPGSCEYVTLAPELPDAGRGEVDHRRTESPDRC